MFWLDPTDLHVTFHLTVEYTFSSSKRLIRATKSETHRDRVRRLPLCSLAPVSVPQGRLQATDCRKNALISETLFLLTVYYTKRHRLKSVKVKGTEERVQERTGSNVELSSPSRVLQAAIRSPSCECDGTHQALVWAYTEHSPEMHALVPIWFPTNV